MDRFTSLRFVFTRAPGEAWEAHATLREGGPNAGAPVGTVRLEARGDTFVLTALTLVDPPPTGAASLGPVRAELLSTVLEQLADAHPDACVVADDHGDPDLTALFTEVGFGGRARVADGTRWTLHPADRLDAPERIGLGLSGGGLRSAGYGLGVLALLDEVGLEPKVRVVCAVSGGALTAGAYAAARAESWPFARFAAHAARVLGADDAVSVVSRHPSLPRRYADDLDARLGPGPRGAWRLGHLCTADTALDELVLQSCELGEGRSFVFAASRDDSVRVSSGTGGVDPEAADHVRLADAVTASACFPIGFEPFLFPDHFDGLPNHPTYGRGVPLTDGGVYDNQAIDSLLQAVRRPDNDLDLLLVADADPHAAELPTGPEPFKLSQLAYYAEQILGWRSWNVPVGAALAALFVPAILGPLWAVALVAFGLALPAAAAWGTRWMLPRGVTVLPNLVPWRLVPTLEVRLRTAFALLVHVSMRRGRRVSYERLFAPSSARPVPTTAVLATDLPRYAQEVAHDPWSRTSSLARRLRPSRAALDAAATTRALRTTLRLRPGERLDDLVLAGRATACLKLVSWLETTPRVRTARARGLLAHLHAHWDTTFRAAT